MEDLGIAVGQQGPYHDQHERVAQQAQDIVGGLSPVGIEAVDLQVFRGYLVHQVADAPDQVAEAEHDDDNLEEVGQEAHDGLHDTDKGVPDVAEDGIGERLGLREHREQQGNEEQQQQENGHIAQHIEARQEDNALTVQVEHLIVLDGQRLRAAQQTAQQTIAPVAVAPVDSPYQTPHQPHNAKDIEHAQQLLAQAVLGM